MAEQAKFVIIKHDGKQIGVLEDLDLKKLQTTLSGQTNVVVRIGNFILAKGMIHAIVRAENTIEAGNNMHMIVARCNVYVNATDVNTTLDKIESETNSKEFVLIDDSVLFFRLALEVAQPL
ncbi:hypothetical protein QIX46_19840 [Lysinibacillus boronitolerans]|nr:hypothetical protein QIX46_19840 [Lysinibacillus boronitolerans]